jgi:hypothetical protein
VTFFTYASFTISIHSDKALRILRHAERFVARDGRFAPRKVLERHVLVMARAPCYVEVVLPSVPNLEILQPSYHAK